MPNSPHIKAVQSFAVAAQHLNFTHSGEQLGVTPGAVSRMVAKLETHLGQQLFHRSPRGLRLTEAGSELFESIDGPLETIAAALERLQRPLQDNRVNLVCHPTVAARWLLPRWSRFYRQHPEIDVQITTTLIDVDFSRDRATDIAIQLSPTAAADAPGSGIAETLELRRDHLSDIDIIAVCAPGILPEDAGETEAIAALKNGVLIHAEPLVDEWRGWLASYAATAAPEQGDLLQAIPVDQGPVFQTMELALQAAAERVGVTLAFSELVAEDLASGRLVSPLPFTRRSARAFQLVSPRNRARIPAVRRYREWLLSEANRFKGGP